jgi:hypothetical protein
MILIRCGTPTRTTLEFFEKAIKALNPAIKALFIIPNQK